MNRNRTRSQRNRSHRRPPHLTEPEFEAWVSALYDDGPPDDDERFADWTPPGYTPEEWAEQEAINDELVEKWDMTVNR